MDSLQSCPFCGGEPKLIDNRLCWGVQCAGCGATVVGTRVEELEDESAAAAVNWDEVRQSAIDKWNRRVVCA